MSYKEDWEIEQWCDIPGYEGDYQVSSLGRVKSIKSNSVILKPDIKRNGYHVVCLWKTGRKKNYLLHRIVAKCFVDNPYDYTDVNHIDENKANNKVVNLEWCTHKYNMNYGQVKNKISIANKGRRLTPEHRKKCASAIGKVWMSTENKERLIKKDDIPSFIHMGYKKGRRKAHV